MSDGREIAAHEFTVHTRGARISANVISVVLHPIFIPLYVTAFALFVHPLLFAGYDDSRKFKLLATVFVNLTFLPAVTVLLSWRLGFLDGVRLKSQRDRIIPLAAAMIFYFWCWFALRGFIEIPEIFRDFLLGSFLTIIAGWLANIAFKISLHTLAAGGMLAFLLIVVFQTAGGSPWYMAAGLVLAGLIGSARLVVSAHLPFDIYAGFVLGFVCQLIAVVV